MADIDAIHVTPRPAEVFVVAMNGRVVLMVNGDATDETRSLVDEMRESFVVTGTPADQVEVVWQHR